jgi:hypothetical protein
MIGGLHPAVNAPLSDCAHGLPLHDTKTNLPHCQAGEQGDLARVFDLVEGRGEDIDEEGVEVALAQVGSANRPSTQ